MSNDQGNELSRTVELSSNDIEKLEEAKLMAKFPNTGRPINGHSAFLQKRLAKGGPAIKFLFTPHQLLQTGRRLFVYATLLSQLLLMRGTPYLTVKCGINGKQKYFDSGDYQMAKQKYTAKPKPAGVLPTGDAIPTPETVPQRKTSIIQQKFNTSSTS